jgi:Transposase IS66 family
LKGTVPSPTDVQLLHARSRGFESLIAQLSKTRKRIYGVARNAESAFAQADETRWMVFSDLEGKTGHRWWLWVFLGEDTVVFRLDPSRSHEVPEGHFPAGANVVLMVDRYAAYKAMAQVKLGDGKASLKPCCG